VAWRWHRRPAGAVDRAQPKLRLETLQVHAGLTRAARREEERHSTRTRGGSCGHRFVMQLMTDEIEIRLDREAVLTADYHLMDRHVISTFLFLVRKM